MFRKTSLVFLLSLVLVSACASLIPVKVGPAADITIEATPERLVRGEYIATKVALCMDCHSQRDYTKFGGPIKPGTYGGGGERFGPEQGLPGTIYSKNITPAGIGDWTDGEIFRTITTGATKDGDALFPIMPYTNYRSMTEEDAYSVIAYVRSLEPLDNVPPPRKLNFPLPLIVRTMPKDVMMRREFDTNNPVEYGEYLVTIASCRNCHTQQDKKGRPVVEMDLAGGFAMKFQNGSIVRTSNITPDMDTGIGNLSRDNFIGRFKAFDNENVRHIDMPKDIVNTVMPWLYYSGMTEDDLGAIYDYLRTVEPISNRVEKYTYMMD